MPEMVPETVLKQGRVEYHAFRRKADGGDANLAPDTAEVTGQVIFTAHTPRVMLQGSTPPVTVFLDPVIGVMHEGELGLWKRDLETGESFFEAGVHLDIGSEDTNPESWQWVASYHLKRGRTHLDIPDHPIDPVDLPEYKPLDHAGTVCDLTVKGPVPLNDPVVILRGLQGEQGPPIDLDAVDTYADLPDDLTVQDRGKWFLVTGLGEADYGMAYRWTGNAFPAEGQGIQFGGRGIASWSVNGDAVTLHFTDGTSESHVLPPLTAAISAAQSAQVAAETAAGTATTQAGEATTQAGIATTQAGHAADSATAASGYASAAAGSAAAANDAEEAAEGHAQTASGHATTATTQAGIATTQAGNAASSAVDADTARQGAEDARDLALQYRNTAATHASNASDSADAAAVSEQNAETYALAVVAPKFMGSYATYATLISEQDSLGTSDLNKAWLVEADGRLYVWDGEGFPAAGQGIPFRGPQGQAGATTYKDPVRVGVDTNIDVNAPGATLGGITMAPDDRVLLMGQTDLVENGIYLWKGATEPLEYSSDFLLGTTQAAGTFTVITEGVFDDRVKMLTSNASVVVGTDPQTWGAMAITVDWDSGVSNKPSTFPPSAHPHDAGDITSGALVVARGGTGAGTATGARANLGLAIGEDVQAFHAKLAALAGLTGGSNSLPYFNGSNTMAQTALTAFIRGLLAAADAAAARGTLEAEATITPGTVGQYWSGEKTWETLNKAAVGLGNVDNTSDADKPISTATQSELTDLANDIAAVESAAVLSGDVDEMVLVADEAAALAAGTGVFAFWLED